MTAIAVHAQTSAKRQDSMTNPETGFAPPVITPYTQYFDVHTDRPPSYDLFGKNTRRWNVIYADPNWDFATRSDAGRDRSASTHYACASIDDICSLPVQELAAPDCALFMWATDPHLQNAFKVISAWGFEYSTVAFYWAKTTKGADLKAMHEVDSFPIGNGYSTRANVEPMLLATKGEPARALHMIRGKRQPDMSIRRLQFAKRLRHSEKPAKFRKLIQRLYQGPYIELFARHRAPGWDAWGNQVGLLDNPEASMRQKPIREPAAAPLLESALS